MTHPNIYLLAYGKPSVKGEIFIKNVIANEVKQSQSFDKYRDRFVFMLLAMIVPNITEGLLPM
jgi:hypothetical protein